MTSGDGRDTNGGGNKSAEGGVATARPTPDPAGSSSMGDSPTLTPEDAALAGAATAVASRSQQMAITAPEEMTRAEREQLVGQVLADRYEVTAQIGAGGMGAVYEARHTIIGKRVAIKVLLEKYAEKDQVIARLEQEARLASSIGHANIVDITDFGTTADGRRFVVMEYLEGLSLGELLKREGALPTSRIVRICRQIASALGAAHEKGVVHRDVKPENVFLIQRDGQDFVKVVDFGISKAVRQDEAGDESPRLTQTGMVLGTPLYMSPEQARGDEDLDHRIDVYALGVIMYELATGEVPFRGTNYLNIISQVLSAEPPPPSEVRPDLNISEPFEAIVLKALEKDRAVRYQSMAELAEDLKALAEDGTVGAVSGSFWAMKKRGAAKRSPGRMLAWAGGVIGVVGVATAAVIATMGGSDDAKPAPALAPTPDAAVTATPATDAAPTPPAVDVVEIQLESVPAGANVWADDGRRFICQTPCPWKAVKQNKVTTLIFEIDGYDDATVELNPLTASTPQRVRLDKTKKGSRRKTLRKSSGDGTPAPPPKTTVDDTVGGELMGNPVRRKKNKQKKTGGDDSP